MFDSTLGSEMITVVRVCCQRAIKKLNELERMARMLDCNFIVPLA